MQMVLLDLLGIPADGIEDSSFIFVLPFSGPYQRLVIYSSFLSLFRLDLGFFGETVAVKL